MTTDKTTALEALNRLAIACEPCNQTMRDIRLIREALAAFEQPAVREMTVEEVACFIESRTSAKNAALALAKLGAIRVVEDV